MSHCPSASYFSSSPRALLYRSTAIWTLSVLKSDRSFQACRQLLLSDLRRRFVAMTPNQPGLVVALLKLQQRQAEILSRLERLEPQQVSLERPDTPFRTAVAWRFPHKLGRTGEPQKPHLVLEHLRHILAAMIMPEAQPVGNILPDGSEVGTDALANRLQRLKAGALRGRVNPDTLRRTMIDRDKDGGLAVLLGPGRGHIRAPHRITAFRDDGPVT